MKTKKLLFALGFIFLSILAHAQGLENIIVEKYYVSNKADSIQADIESNEAGYPIGSLPVGSVTYRFYADMLPGYKLLSVYADATKNQLLKFTTSTSFYNHPNGSMTAPVSPKSQLKNNLQSLDTYLSLGGAALNNFGILKSEDDGAANNVTIANNPSGVLLNNDVSAGLPLTTQDGMIAGSNIIFPSLVGIYSTSNEAALGDGSSVGNSFVVLDGSIYSTSGAVGPVPSTNKVLIAQITTNGLIHYELNLLIQKIGQADGEFYAAHPQGNDLFIPSLLNSSDPSAPYVQIAYPANNAVFAVGDSILLNAYAGDSDGSIVSLEYFVDNTSVGIDVTPPFNDIFSYVAVSGTHIITAKAIDNDGNSAVSDPVTITVGPPNTQKGLENIIVEKYYISNAADAAQADAEAISNGQPAGALPPGSVTYRFYVDMLPGYKFLALYGDETKNQSFKFTTTTSFYNNPNGLSIAPGVSKALLKNSLLSLDSYLTVGAVANGNLGILKTEDNGADNNITITNNPDGVLLNTDPKMGIPLITQDGMIDGVTTIPGLASISSTDLLPFADGSISGNSLIVTEGNINSSSGSPGPVPGTNRVLIAQVTTNGKLHYELNIVLKSPSGLNAEYYAAFPSPSDNTNPTLIGDLFPPKSYTVENTTGICSDSVFCLPIAAADTVEDVIGYDMVLHYDKTKVHPTGNITISNDLINAGYASYAFNDNSAAGEINISVFLNASAPANTTFNGTGKLVCVEFTKDASLSAVDTVDFNVTDLQESYANGVQIKTVFPGKYINKKSPIHKGALQFWTDNSPIKYDAANPGDYLITNIYGTDSNCMNKSAVAVQPDLGGVFSYDIVNGSSIQIERDILPATDVQPVINGFDASLGHKVVVNDLSFIPNIFQAIALDVNADGVISAGDISQINQRSVKTITEFKQKWNYNSNGTSNGQLSKDWLFVDSTLLALPAYQISTTYPSNDGVGFSKSKVPVVPFCLAVPVSNSTSCPAYEQSAYTGILLGDVNGNYDAIPADGQLKREAAITANGTIFINLDQAKLGAGYIDVPVSISSTDAILSLDFATKFNENALSFDKVVATAPYLTDAMANYAKDDKILRFTSNSRQQYENNKTIVTVRFNTLTGVVSNTDLFSLAGYLNGDKAKIELKGNIATGISTTSADISVLAYPNPANGILNVVSPERAAVELMDLQGRQVVNAVMANANEKTEINTEELASGMYLLKVSNQSFISTQRIVIDNIR